MKKLLCVALSTLLISMLLTGCKAKETQEKVKEQQAQKAKRYRVEKDW